eukprot:2304560-Amphidinium_carterae.1
MCNLLRWKRSPFLQQGKESCQRELSHQAMQRYLFRKLISKNTWNQVASEGGLQHFALDRLNTIALQ